MAQLYWDVFYTNGTNNTGFAVPTSDAEHARKFVQDEINANYPGYHITKVTGPYTSQAAAVKALGNIGKTPTPNEPGLNITDPVAAWLSSMGGSIASGLEGAGVAFLKDLWNVILGPIEILIGSAIAMVILVYAFKDDLMSIAAIAGRGAA